MEEREDKEWQSVPVRPIFLLQRPRFPVGGQAVCKDFVLGGRRHVGMCVDQAAREQLLEEIVKKSLKISVFVALLFLGAGLLMTGCKSAPELSKDKAQSLIQAKYDADPAVPAIINVNDLGMQQGFTAKYWVRSKQYPNKYWADFTLTDDGKKVIKLQNGGSVIEWRPASLDDKTYFVLVNSAAANHLKAKDLHDPQDETDGSKTVVFNEAADMTGVPAPLQDIAHNPGNKLSTKRTATFVVDGGAWKLQSIH